MEIPTGIGLMIVKALEQNGAKVYIVGRRKEVLEKVAKEEAVSTIYQSVLSWRRSTTDHPSPSVSHHSGSFAIDALCALRNTATLSPSKAMQPPKTT